MKLIKLLALVVSFTYSLSLVAHGDLHKRINSVTKLIAIYPDSSNLYLKRGKLYLEHNDFDSSIQDLKKCGILNSGAFYRHYLLAKAYYCQSELSKANREIQRFLRQKPNHVKALRLSAKILLAKQKYQSAALTFEKIIQIAREKIPENYLEACNAWKALGKKGHYRAKVVLCRGLTDLGDLTLFYQELQCLEVEQGNYFQAILLASKVLNKANRKEWAFYQRALIHYQFEHFELAYADFKNAQIAIDLLPARIRNIQSCKKLFESIKKHIFRLSIDKVNYCQR